VVLSTRLRVALLAALMTFAFQALTVHFNYGGNWTGLFCAGDRWQQPPDLARPYEFHDSWGYDGQFYRLIAHDPLLRRGYARYLDDPQYRYSRILLPALAYGFALGDDRFIDGVYIAIMLAFVFAGAWWLAMLAEQRGWPLATGLLFLLVPAVLVGIDRMAIDLALAALCVGFAALRKGSAGWFAVLASAALCRETGLLLIAAACAGALWERQFRRAVGAGLTAVPALAWLWWIHGRVPASSIGRTSFIPLAGFITRWWHPMHYSLSPVIAAFTQVFDYIALAGVALAVWCCWRLRERWIEFPELAAYAIPVLFVSLPDVWTEPFAFGRTMTPFWLFVAIRGAQSRQWIALAPMALIDLRIVWQLGSELLGILRGLVT
jgi:hypothetical protein